MRDFLLSLLCLILLPACSTVRQEPENWQPPEHPDPEEILNSIHDDVVAKRYQTALAKHVWFFDNALHYKPELYGVRLLNGLREWAELAKIYPPARVKLKEARDKALKQVHEGEDVWPAFQDLTSLNHHLDEDTLTKDTFLLLHQQNPTAARTVFQLAQPALVKAGEYTVCGQYLEPESFYQNILEIRHAELRLSQTPQSSPNTLMFSDKRFTSDVGILVALLVVNDRADEAHKIANQARQEWDNADFHKALDSALTGKVPPLWPN